MIEQAVIYRIEDKKGRTVYIGSTTRFRERALAHKANRYGRHMVPIVIVPVNQRYFYEREAIHAAWHAGLPISNKMLPDDGTRIATKLPERWSFWCIDCVLEYSGAGQRR